MDTLRYAGVLLLVLFVATPAMAQDDGEKKAVSNEKFGVTVNPPEGDWEVTEGNEKAVANFKHSGSQSQIEVVGTKLMTDDVSDVFFETFHKTLKESNFERQKQEEAKIGGMEGTRTTYKFEHSGVTLSVTVFEFLKNSTAWLVVGYMQKDKKDEYAGAFESVVKQMEFSEPKGDGEEE